MQSCHNYRRVVAAATRLEHDLVEKYVGVVERGLGGSQLETRRATAAPARVPNWGLVVVLPLRALAPAVGAAHVRRIRAKLKRRPHHGRRCLRAHSACFHSRSVSKSTASVERVASSYLCRK